MGWASGINREGREVGYAIEATCDQEGCDTKIDRGLAYVCGGMHDGDEFGCGKYFCYSHLFYVRASGDDLTQLCPTCSEQVHDLDDDEEDE